MIFAFAFAVSVIAAAPAQAAPDGESIVINGQADTRKTVEQFVRSLTPTIWQGQISRFEHSVCPGVYGLAKPQSEAIVKRMRQVAQAVGIPVDGPNCYPNLVLIATSDKTMLLDELEHHRGEIFGGMSSGDIHAMERDPEPAAAWQLRGAPISASGMDLYWDEKMGAWVNRTTDAASHINESARPQFDAAVVIVEKRALSGLTVTQLGDYAVIRALTGANPEKLGNGAAPTILHVLDVPIGGEAPVTMTQWDFAFLRSFYDVRRYLRAGAQRSAIADEVAKSVQSPPPRRQQR